MQPVTWTLPAAGLVPLYTGYLVLAAPGSAALPTFRAAMGVVVPLTVVTLLAQVALSSRESGREGG